MRVVLENLLGNAWKFTGAAAQPRVELGSDRRTAEIAYFVRDNGAGFDMAYASRLFAPFQRLHTEAEFPGTGIGLATVARIIDRHGGRVWAEGKVGAGAAVFFTVPPLRGRGLQ
jgi:light-regulated signal transduction histidine kinase (bacteriophytochrome)